MIKDRDYRTDKIVRTGRIRRQHRGPKGERCSRSEIRILVCAFRNFDGGITNVRVAYRDTEILGILAANFAAELRSSDEYQICDRAQPAKLSRPVVPHRIL